MSNAVKTVELGCQDLVGIRSELSAIRQIDGHRGFTNEELARARSFLVEKGLISDELQSVTAGSVKRFMTRLDALQNKIPGSCETFTKSIRITISESRSRFAMSDFAFVEMVGGMRDLTDDELYIVGAASMATGVDDLFEFDVMDGSFQVEVSRPSGVISSAIIMNEEFPSEREGELWEMVGRAYDALEGAREAMGAGDVGSARRDLNEAIEVIFDMGITRERLRDLWDKHRGLALDVWKLTIGTADLLHEMGEEERAFDMLAGNITVPYGGVSLIYDYSFAKGFGYPPPKQTSPECSYDLEDRSWAENTYRKLKDQLAGKINCFEAVRAGSE